MPPTGEPFATRGDLARDHSEEEAGVSFVDDLIAHREASARSALAQKTMDYARCVVAATAHGMV